MTKHKTSCTLVPVTQLHSALGDLGLGLRLCSLRDENNTELMAAATTLLTAVKFCNDNIWFVAIIIIIIIVIKWYTENRNTYENIQKLRKYKNLTLNTTCNDVLHKI